MGGALIVLLAGIGLVVRELVQVLRSRLCRRQRSLILVSEGGGSPCSSMPRWTPVCVNRRWRSCSCFAGPIVSVARLINRGTDAIMSSRFGLAWWGMSTARLLLLLGAEVSRLGMAWLTFDAGIAAGRGRETGCRNSRIEERDCVDPGKSLHHHGLGIRSTRERLTHPATKRCSVGA